MSGEPRSAELFFPQHLQFLRISSVIFLLEKGCPAVQVNAFSSAFPCPALFLKVLGENCFFIVLFHLVKIDFGADNPD